MGGKRKRRNSLCNVHGSYSDVRGCLDDEDRTHELQADNASARPIDSNAVAPLADNVQTHLRPHLPAYSPANAVAEQRRLPHLPPISNTDLRQAVFTHQGALKAEDAKHEASYERLEILGDAYIEVIASRIIFERFKDLSAGRLSQVREFLVKNETLARFSRDYGFHHKIKLPPDLAQEIHNFSSKVTTKILGDVFEAYVAGIIQSSPETGFSTAEIWLGQLWESRLLEFDAETESTKSYKQDLMRKVGGKKVKVSYEESKPPNQVRDRPGQLEYHVEVYLNGWGWNHRLLGSGTGRSKQDAGHRAASMALRNKELMDEIEAVKAKKYQVSPLSGDSK